MRAGISYAVSTASSRVSDPLSSEDVARFVPSGTRCTSPVVGSVARGTRLLRVRSDSTTALRLLSTLKASGAEPNFFGRERALYLALGSYRPVVGTHVPEAANVGPNALVRMMAPGPAKNSRLIYKSVERVSRRRATRSATDRMRAPYPYGLSLRKWRVPWTVQIRPHERASRRRCGRQNAQELPFMSEKKISLMIYLFNLVFSVAISVGLARMHMPCAGSSAEKGFSLTCARASPATQPCLRACANGGRVAPVDVRTTSSTSTVQATGGTRVAARAGSGN